MTLSPEHRGLIETTWQSFRSAGIDEPVIAIEQMAYLIAARRLDGRRRLKLGDLGRYLDWAQLQDLPGVDLIDLMRSSLIPAVASSMPPAIRPTIEEAHFAIEDPTFLRLCMSRIDMSVSDWADPVAGADVFEVVLGWLEAAGDSRHLRTPPVVAAAMVELAEPRFGDRVCDPAVGTGGLLLTVAEQVRAAGGSDDLPALWGFDVDPGMARLAAFNLLFHGYPGRVAQADALAPDFASDIFDVVICAPPFGGARTGQDVDEDLAPAGKRTELLFLERCRRMLGRSAAILLPEAVLFGRGEQFLRARQEWLQRSRVRAVILLPPGVLGIGNVHSAILLASGSGVTEDVWFCTIGEGRELPIAADDREVATELGLVKEALRSRDEGVAAGPAAEALAERMFSVSLDRIAQNDWILAPAFYPEEKVDEGLPEGADPIALLEEVVGIEDEIVGLLDDARRLMANPE
jgi:type I restriction enzyme M protein